MLLSGYRLQMYDDALTGWDSAEFTTTDRGGNVRTEVLWANYQLPPAFLHDSRYVGEGWRKRQLIKRVARRRSAGLWKLPAHERQAVIEEFFESGLIDWYLDGMTARHSESGVASCSRQSHIKFVDMQR